MPKKIAHSYDELVKKAQFIFWTQGYKATTQEQLAKELDVSVSTIYNKYTKDMLFLDALDNYLNFCSDPVLKEIRRAQEGIESFRSFFYLLVDALLDREFPRSCLIVNTIIEVRDDEERVSMFYRKYFDNMETSYKTVLMRAVDLGEIKDASKIGQYTEFLKGVIFSLSILFRLKTRSQLREYVDEQLSLIQ